MLVDGRPLRSIRFDAAASAVIVIDQRELPHALRLVALESLDAFATAIAAMWVRGAPLIGATAAWGIARQMRRDASDRALDEAADVLLATRPTAVNLRWAIDAMRAHLAPMPPAARAEAAHALAERICDDDVRTNRRIGDHGLGLIRAIAANKPPGARIDILTHCNAGWLATVDWGTATAPIYRAHDEGIPVHVWVDETRPRNQGAALTCWELRGHGVPHTLIADNAGGHLMQHGRVDLVIVGSDRTTATGDVCNKIGTYLKALAAHDNGVPFYVALPTSTIDWTLGDGLAGVPIEMRAEREVTHLRGRLDDDGARVAEIAIAPPGTPAANPAFDVTPARLVSGLVTEHGLIDANAAALAALRTRCEAGERR
ncbi:MAG: S-methyl-5-thioribose-1-phosphate isomerase [Lautropia sp.]